MKTDGLRAEAQMARLVERILSLISVVGSVCLCIGLALFIVGRALNNSIVAHVGAYILVIGVVLVVVRIMEWIAEKMIGRGLESTPQEK